MRRTGPRVFGYVVAVLATCLPLTSAVTKTDGPNGSFSVAVTVHAACSVAATDMTFAGVDATSTITVTCADGTPYNVRLGTRMPGAPANAPDVTSPSGLVVTTKDSMAGTGNGRPQTITVHGRMLAGRVSPNQTGSEIVTVTINY
jgi:spore coat protein U domain-containing protein, fimbrial subunit CupE1/2/3/6